MNNVEAFQPRFNVFSTSLALERQHLPPTVIPARRTRSVRRHGAAALRAFIQVRRMPAVRRPACPQAHLGRFAFWNSHGRRLSKHGFCEKQPPARGFAKSQAVKKRPT